MLILLLLFIQLHCESVIARGHFLNGLVLSSCPLASIETLVEQRVKQKIHQDLIFKNSQVYILIGCMLSIVAMTNELLDFVTITTT